MAFNGILTAYENNTFTCKLADLETVCPIPFDLFVMVVEFGADSTQRISQILGKMKIRHLILKPTEIPMVEPTHIILSGGPKHVYEVDHYSLPIWVQHAKAPVLGICYGMQLVAATFGGYVRRMAQKEKGSVEVTEFIDGQQTCISRWMHRWDRVISVPKGFKITGVTRDNHVAAYTDNVKWWGIQYHPEAPNYVDSSVFCRFLQLSPTT